MVYTIPSGPPGPPGPAGPAGPAGPPGPGLTLGEVVYVPTSQFPVNGLYDAASQRVFGVQWSSRFGSGLMGPGQGDTGAAYPGGIPGLPLHMGTTVNGLSIGGITYQAMVLSTTVVNSSPSCVLDVPVPPGAVSVTGISLYTFVFGSTFVVATSSITLSYNPQNGNAGASGSRGAIGANDGAPVQLTIPGPFGAPTPNELVRITLDQNYGVGEAPVLFQVFYSRLAITWA